MTSYHHAQVRLAQQINTTIQRSVQDHRRYIETLSEQAVKDGGCVGFVELDGSGEFLLEIEFPLLFVERPIFNAGLELTGNQQLDWGALPTWSATVTAWTTDTVAENDLWIGATLAIVTFNTLKADLHYSFEARSLTNPTGPNDSVGQTL